MLESTVQTLRTIFAIVVFGLLVTGGYRGQFEFSQIDVFGYLLLILSYVLFKRTGTLFPDFINHRVSKIVLAFDQRPKFWIFVFLFSTCALYFTIHLVQHLSFHTNLFDMTFVEQSVWATAKLWPQQKLLASSVSRGGTYFGEHFSPILILLAPLLWIYDSPLQFFWAQPLILSSGLFFIFALARHRKLSAGLTLALLLGYLLYQPLRAAQVFNLKEDVFYIPTLFAAIWAAETKRWPLFWGAVVCSFLVKENAPLATVWLGLWIWFRGHKKAGLLLVLLSGAVFVFLNFHLSAIMAGGEKRAILAERLSFLGSTPKDIGLNVLSHPFESVLKIQQHILKPKSLFYFWKVLLPFLPFIFLRPLQDGILFIGGIALLAANLLFTSSTLGYHYEIILVPFLFSALVFSFSRLQQKQFWAPALFLGLIFCAFGRSPVLTLRENWPNKKHLCLNQALADIPAELSIATQSDLMPHLHRRMAITTLKDATTVHEDVIILSFMEGMSFYASDGAKEAAKHLDPAIYQSVLNHPDLLIWCRSGDGCKNLSQYKIPSCLSGF